MSKISPNVASNGGRAGPPRSKFARHMDRLIQKSGKAQNTIAFEMGYEKANIISMFKTGVTRVPLDRLPALAAALNTDPTDLVSRWLSEFEPTILDVVKQAAGFPISETEQGWIEKLREAFPSGVPAFDERHEGALKTAIEYEAGEWAKVDRDIASEAGRREAAKGKTKV